MERASRVLGKVPFPKDSVTAGDLALAGWKAAVGERLAAHARAEKLVRQKLVVGVDDAVWRRQLFTMSGMILEKIRKVLGPGIVEELEFRIAPPRRPPARETLGRKAAPLFDEADRIADPALRRIYRAARKKELA